jgi:hypothetical protein
MDMSPTGPNRIPKRRRPRCNFHFKVDETLRAEDRENYRALVRCPHMRIDDAHAWLRAQGYAVSRSAVARHRRQVLATDAANDLELRRAAQFARITSGDRAPDFISGARVRLQQIVFERLLDLQTPTDEDRREGRVNEEGTRVISPAELLAFAKLVSHCVKLEQFYLEQLEVKDRAARRDAETALNEPASAPPATDEELIRRMQDIMGKRV